MRWAGDSQDVEDGKNRKLPIDSEEAAGYRMLKSVQDAERALNRAVIACVSKLEDEKCSLEFIRELVCGDYNVTSATPISVQRRNAETTVEIVGRVPWVTEGCLFG